MKRTIYTNNINLLYIMKKNLYICLSLICIFSCNKKENHEQPEVASKEFTQGGIHFTVTNNCPLSTKAQGDDVESYTVIGEKDGTLIKLYTIDTVVAPDFVTSETFFEDGTLISTAILYHNRVVNYEVSPELMDSYYELCQETKSLKSWWSGYKKCVTESANEMSRNVSENPIDRATCEWVPCETIILAVSAFDCLVK